MPESAIWSMGNGIDLTAKGGNGKVNRAWQKVSTDFSLLAIESLGEFDRARASCAS